MNVEQSLAHRAKHLRGVIERNAEKIPRLRTEVDRLRVAYHDACEKDIPPPNVEAENLHRKLVKLISELEQCESESREATPEVAGLDRMLNSELAEKSARSALRDAKAQKKIADERLNEGVALVFRLKAQLDTEKEAEQIASALVSPDVIRELGPDVQALFADQPKDATVGDVQMHAARVRALSEALAKAKTAAAEHGREVAAADAFVQEAKTELVTSLSAYAELQHRKALAEYLGSLVFFRAAHRVAYDLDPGPPDVELLSRQTLDEAIESIRENVDDVDASPRQKRFGLPDLLSWMRA